MARTRCCSAVRAREVQADRWTAGTRLRRSHTRLASRYSRTGAGSSHQTRGTWRAVARRGAEHEGGAGSCEGNEEDQHPQEGSDRKPRGWFPAGEAPDCGLRGEPSPQRGESGQAPQPAGVRGHGVRDAVLFEVQLAGLQLPVARRALPVSGGVRGGAVPGTGPGDRARGQSPTDQNLETGPWGQSSGNGPTGTEPRDLHLQMVRRVHLLQRLVSGARACHTPTF